MSKRNEFDESEYTLKGFIIKLFLILTIIIVLIWLIPKFFLYKKSKQHEEIKEDKGIVLIENSTLNSVETAGVKHFNEGNIPTKEKESKKVTLKELQNEKLISDVKSSGVTCDNNKTYVEITKNINDYTLKTYVKCSSETKQKTTYLNNYSYCNDNYLCERNEQKEKELKEQEERQRNLSVPDTGVNDGETKELTAFGPWKNYQKTSCDKQEMKCDINNTNCLREVKVERKQELSDIRTNTYYTEHTSLKLNATQTQLVCSNYNYIVISNHIFRTTGNYEEVLQLSKRSTSSWTYKGEITTKTSPYYGANEYYKYVSTDDNLVHKYDSYKYNYPMDEVTSFTIGCTNLENRSINYYSVYKKQETITKTKNIYSDVCYSSERTREYK